MAIEHTIPRSRPIVTKGVTKKISTSECGSLYVTLNEDEQGLCEVFVNMGRSGGCRNAQCAAMGVLISIALRAGIEPAFIGRRLKGIRCASPSIQNGSHILSCVDAIGKAIEAYLIERGDIVPAVIEKSERPISVSKPEIGCVDCPECGHKLEFSEGCMKCIECGYSKCG